MKLKERKKNAAKQREFIARNKERGLVQTTVYVPVERKDELRELARRWCAENVRDQDSIQ